jgi:predicted DNA-binding transcriptional regulator YafY
VRADRLISILLLLQTNGQMTARELAEKLEVSERTIYRDMEALSSSGIPIFAEQGRNGGWTLLEGYETKLTGLKKSEILSLLISPSIPLLNDLGLSESSIEARKKLIASLPVPYRDNVHDGWNRIHIDTSTWHQQQDKIASFEILKAVIWKEHKLKLTYQKHEGTYSCTVVKPLGLVAKGSRWYFVAAKENDEIRSYRASRIQTVEVLEETFQRPKTFDLAQYWTDSTNQFIKNLPTYNVQVAVHPSALPRVTFTDRFVQVVEYGNTDQAGWILVKLSFNTEEEAKAYILGYANQMRVIKPKKLSDQIYAMAKATVAFYDKKR